MGFFRLFLKSWIQLDNKATGILGTRAIIVTMSSKKMPRRIYIINHKANLIGLSGGRVDGSNKSCRNRFTSFKEPVALQHLACPGLSGLYGGLACLVWWPVGWIKRRGWCCRSTMMHEFQRTSCNIFCENLTVNICLSQIPNPRSGALKIACCNNAPAVFTAKLKSISLVVKEGPPKRLN